MLGTDFGRGLVDVGGGDIQLQLAEGIQLEQPLVRDVGERTLVVGVDAHAQAGHAVSFASLSRR